MSFISVFWTCTKERLTLRQGNTGAEFDSKKKTKSRAVILCEYSYVKCKTKLSLKFSVSLHYDSDFHVINFS